MRSSTRQAVPVRATKLATPSHRTTDIVGVIAVSIGLLIALALLLGNAGIVGDGLGNLFRTLFGRGAWVAPFVCFGFGAAMLAGRQYVEGSRMAWGLGLVFTSIVGALSRSRAGDYFDPEIVADSGGYVGAVIGWSLHTLLGNGMLIGLGALCMVGLILCMNDPLRALAAALAERAKKPKPKIQPRPTERQKPIPAQAVVQVREDAPEPRRKPAPSIVTPLPVLATGESIPKEGYKLPPITLLAEPHSRPKRTAQEMQRNIATLERTLEEFGIDANVVEVAAGPTITRYEIQLGPGIRVARITALADNIAMNLAASHVRVEAPIPGKSAIGVEVPNIQPTMVSLREVVSSQEFQQAKSRLILGLGQDVSGVNKYADLSKMPHLLIGGATNSGKSIGLATIITSLLMRNTPKDCRLVLIDPKRVELSLFEGVPHLMCPVVKDVKEAPAVLRAVWREMDKRYDLFSEHGVRNIDSWNETATFQERLPYIVVVIDELADLMIQAAAEVETSICRLAQLARATGIHLVIATQRPSVDVITGTIKANIASRIAFSVSSQVDSRTILDQGGAERLVGKGDMLFLPIESNKATRIQGCYVGEKEIEAVCSFWKAQEKPHYVLNPIHVAIADREAEMSSQESDPLWEETVRWVVERGQASTSMLQRRFAIGFQRASRLLDLMQERGIVGPRDGARPREVLVDPMNLDAALGRQVLVEPHVDLETDPLD